MQQNTYVVIMAGGVGSRFWPLSREKKPKQFLDLLGVGKSLLQITFDRFASRFDNEQIFVVTSEQYVSDVNSQLPQLSSQNILAEPLRKNTAPCILYSAEYLQQRFGDSILIMSPADHFILEQDLFLKTIDQGVDFIANNPQALLTLGIKPTKPHTGYGYIQYVDNQETVKPVKTFTEKPTVEFAQQFIDSGDFLWNSGIFIWNSGTIIDSFRDYLPDIYDNLSSIDFNSSDFYPQLKEDYSQIPNISIDYGVLEKSKNVFVLPSFFSWSDLGTWDSLYDFQPKDDQNNVLQAQFSVCHASQNNIVHISSNDKLIALQDVHDLIIVDTEDALLICNKNSEQKIKEIVHSLATKQLKQFL